MKQEEVRFTVRLPREAVTFLDRLADENFTSRNAEIVRAVRVRAQMTAGQVSEATAPAAIEQNAARQGGLPITNGKGSTANEYAR